MLARACMCACSLHSARTRSAARISLDSQSIFIAMCTFVRNAHDAAVCEICVRKAGAVKSAFSHAPNYFYEVHLYASGVVCVGHNIHADVYVYMSVNRKFQMNAHSAVQSKRICNIQSALNASSRRLRRNDVLCVLEFEWRLGGGVCFHFGSHAFAVRAASEFYLHFIRVCDKQLSGICYDVPLCAALRIFIIIAITRVLSYSYTVCCCSVTAKAGDAR